MGYIVLDQISIDRRVDRFGWPWQLRMQGILMPEKILVDSIFWLDPAKWPDPRRYPLPNVMGYRKMFPRGAKGQYRAHRVLYNIILPIGKISPWRKNSRIHL